MAINRNDWINEVKQDAYGATGNPAQLSTASGSAPSYSARAWVNFNGSGTVAIRQSANVSSVSDNGVGLYTVNLATPMSNSNYAVAVTATGLSDANNGSGYGRLRQGQTTSSIPIVTAYENAGDSFGFDSTIVCVTVFS